MKTNIDSLTIAEAREIAALFTGKQLPTIASAEPHPYIIGATYLIRTVTMIDTGKIVAVTDKEIVLEAAAWIADTGRFADALKTANFNEVEPFPDGQVIVNRSAIIDAVRIPEFKRRQK